VKQARVPVNPAGRIYQLYYVQFLSEEEGFLAHVAGAMRLEMGNTPAPGVTNGALAEGACSCRVIER
jgi:hypothetical protein